MLKIYDTNKNFIVLLDKCKDACVTSVLETGLQTLSFKLPLTEEHLAQIAEEYYVVTNDARYVVKEVNFDTNSFFSVFCNADIEELQGLISIFDAFDINIEQAMQKTLTLTNSPWRLMYHSANQTAVNYALKETSPYQFFQLIKSDYGLEIWYDTKKQIVHVYDAMGEARGTYFSNELNLKNLKKQGQTYEFATVLYPIGKDGLTIGVINNGVNFIENYDYCNKYIPKYWYQDEIEHAEELLIAARKHLAQISAPITSYGLRLSELPLGVGLGDTIILVDKIKKIKQKQRVVKIVRYPFNPEKDKLELSNQIVNFANVFTKNNNELIHQITQIKKNLI